jgi:hypothetical protein
MSAPTSVTPLRAAARSVSIARWVLAPLLLLLAAACGSPGDLGSLQPANALVQEDLERLDVANAYQAVERLRPDWLRSRGAYSPRNPQASLPTIYVAGVRQQGGPGVLRQVRLGDVREIQYLNSVDATTRYGTDHAGGAILVILR